MTSSSKYRRMIELALTELHSTPIGCSEFRSGRVLGISKNEVTPPRAQAQLAVNYVFLILQPWFSNMNLRIDRSWQQSQSGRVYSDSLSHRSAKDLPQPQRFPPLGSAPLPRQIRHLAARFERFEPIGRKNPW